MRGPRLRSVPLVLVLVLAGVACGGGARSDAPPGIDAPPATVDAVVPTCTPVTGTTVRFRRIGAVPDSVVLVTAPPGDRRQFLVGRQGTIQIIRDDAIVATPFLDLASLSGGPVVAGGSERGLLGLAFHPRYAETGRFFVFYTTERTNGDKYNELAEYRVLAADPDRADRASARVLLSIPDYADNHNAGMIEFGSDGYLYLSTGDGGGVGDPRRTAQDRFRLLGKMLRIDVDTAGGGREYGIPPENPFADGAGGAPEVLMVGLRNPWRWSFDRATGDLYIGDVGQHCVEEIDVLPPGRQRGADLGWSDCEGSRDFHGTGCSAPTQPDRLRPVYEQLRNHPTYGCTGTSEWHAVIGGQVYRGACYPDLVGRYFFADHATAALYSFVYAGGQATDVREHPGEFPRFINSIHADAGGELWVGTKDGEIFRIEVQ